MAATTYAYTRHLLDCAAREDLATGLAAVLPCQWSYGELATPLAAALPADPVYAEWISMFAGEGYGELVQAGAGLLDQRARHGDEARAGLRLAAVLVYQLQAGVLGHGLHPRSVEQRQELGGAVADHHRRQVRVTAGSPADRGRHGQPGHADHVQPE